MAHPSPEAIAYVQARVSDWGPADAAIAAALNAQTAANPAAVAATVLKPFGVADLMGPLSPASLAKVYGRPAVVAFRDDCAAQSRAAVGNWIGLALAAQDITLAEHDAMIAVLRATQPDPSWAANLPAPLVALGRPLDADDIAASRPGG